VRSVNELQFALYLSMKEEKIMQPLLCVALNSSVVSSAIAVTVECVLFFKSCYIRNPYGS
jgi:hypothetical protein